MLGITIPLGSGGGVAWKWDTDQIGGHSEGITNLGNPFLPATLGPVGSSKLTMHATPARNTTRLLGSLPGKTLELNRGNF